MKYFAFIAICLAFFACKKDTLITSPDALVLITADTVKFDTIFATVGSVTQKFMVKNLNDQRLNLSNIALAGGANSAYKIVVNGTPGTQFSNTEIAANDSIYIFVNVTINQATGNIPFIVSDSILIDYNGNHKKVQLQAYGQKARFLDSQTISTNTVWDNTLPYVLLDGLTINPNVTLTISKGTKIYSHATSPIIVNGNIIINGGVDSLSRVYFLGDRMDEGYANLPGSWPGIIFGPLSTGNVFNHAVLLNANQSLVLLGTSSPTSPQLTLNECIIDNAYDAGIVASSSYINARNCRISNCGNAGPLGSDGSNIIIQNGGTYNFNFCTIATYASYFQSHTQPVLYLSDGGAKLTANFTNSIIYGNGGTPVDEVNVNKTGSSFSLSFTNVLITKMKDAFPAYATLNAASTGLLNKDPLFVSADTYRNLFNFRLKSGSPASKQGFNNGVTTDLDGNPRPSLAPDLGCYQTQ
jgi:hypothetical protein